MVKIIADSTCDLSQELLERYDISILPLHVLLGDEEYYDGKTITPDEIYSWADAHKSTPKTSAPSIEDAQSLFSVYLKEDRDIVCFSIASGMSTSGNIMRLAAEELDTSEYGHMVDDGADKCPEQLSLKASEHVYVVDSANLSTGHGLLVIEAAIMAKDGASAPEIAARMEELKPKVRASFVVDTLTYLYRGGRCSGLSALVGGALKLHPKIIVKDGAMQPDKKYRGKLKKVVMAYVKDMEDDLKAAMPDRVFITHSGCDREIVETVRVYLEELHLFSEILETRAGGVVSSHCGPGTLGVLFIAQ